MSQYCCQYVWVNTVANMYESILLPIFMSQSYCQSANPRYNSFGCNAVWIALLRFCWLPLHCCWWLAAPQWFCRNYFVCLAPSSFPLHEHFLRYVVDFNTNNRRHLLLLSAYVFCISHLPVRLLAGHCLPPLLWAFAYSSNDRSRSAGETSQCKSHSVKCATHRCCWIATCHQNMW